MEPPGQALALHLLGNRGREELLALLQFPSRLGAKKIQFSGSQRRETGDIQAGSGTEAEGAADGLVESYGTPSNLMSRGRRRMMKCPAISLLPGN